MSDNFEKNVEYKHIKSLGDLIKNYRVYNELSIPQLSKIVNLASITISDYENDVRLNKIKKKNLKKVTEALHIPDEEIKKFLPDWKTPIYSEIKTLGELLMQSRKSFGYSLNDLSQKVGMNQSTLGDYELGKVNPKQSRLITLVNLLKIPEEEVKKFRPSFRNEPDYTSAKNSKELIRKALEYNNLTRNEARVKAGLKSIKWLADGNTTPTLNLKKLLDSLGVPQDVYEKIVPSLKINLNPSNAKNLGDLIRKHIELKYKDIVEFSRACDVPYEAVWRLTSGLSRYKYYTRTSEENLRKIVNFLGIPTEYVRNFIPDFQPTKSIKSSDDFKQFIQYSEFSEQAKRILEIYGGDTADIADIISVLNPNTIVRSKIIDFLKDPSIREWIGNIRKPDIPLQELIHVTASILPYDKNNMVWNIFVRRAFEYRDKKLGSSPTKKQRQAFIDELDEGLIRLYSRD